MTEAADQYARNWEYFHLEWGNALSYAGHKDEAKKQFALASALDLLREDESALSRWAGKGHD